MIKRSYLIIYLTFIFCLILTTLPLPDWAGPMRPHWVALALIYWCIALPQRIGVFHGFFIGIILDISIGTLFGQHAFTLSIIAFLASNLHARLRIYPIGQQMIVVFILLPSLLLQVLVPPRVQRLQAGRCLSLPTIQNTVLSHLSLKLPRPNLLVRTSLQNVRTKVNINSNIFFFAT